MAEASKKRKKQKPLDNIQVGDNLTAYSRPPSIYDEPHRNRAFWGALVDSRLRRTPDRPFQEVRSEIERYCREVFKNEGLPDPFSFIHPEGRFPALDGWLVLAKGDDYLKSRSELGYWLAAGWHTPSEAKHTPLWYAARLATELTTLDLLIVQIEAGTKPAAEGAALAAATGAKIGALASERGFKLHEPDALRGKEIVSSASEGGKERARTARQDFGEAFQRMKRRIEANPNKAHAARQVIRELRLGVKPESLVKRFNRWSGKER